MRMVAKGIPELGVSEWLNKQWQIYAFNWLNLSGSDGGRDLVQGKKKEAQIGITMDEKGHIVFLF
jgi:hypothetical protein